MGATSSFSFLSGSCAARARLIDAAAQAPASVSSTPSVSATRRSRCCSRRRSTVERLYHQMRMRCSSDIVEMSIATRCWPPSSVSRKPSDGGERDHNVLGVAEQQQPVAGELQGLLDLSVAARAFRERPEVHQEAEPLVVVAHDEADAVVRSLSWLFFPPAHGEVLVDVTMSVSASSSAARRATGGETLPVIHMPSAGPFPTARIPDLVVSVAMCRFVHVAPPLVLGEHLYRPGGVPSAHQTGAAAPPATGAPGSAPRARSSPAPPERARLPLRRLGFRCFGTAAGMSSCTFIDAAPVFSARVAALVPLAAGLARGPERPGTP